MGNLLVKFCDNQTDFNQNDVPDREELIKFIQDQLHKKREKSNKNKLKKIIKIK